ncbi:alpha/beta hydrolase [Hymenobacter humi]|uniref:Alpha/beta hydrolase n=1 Tax=Hymenobacter humi TaxID=1411620 RepID=A0ABW2U3J8_9BACT
MASSRRGCTRRPTGRPPWCGWAARAAGSMGRPGACTRAWRARLAARGIASLRLHYRRPNQLEDCVMDTLIGAEYLALKCGYQSIALVGHSFGGAVVIAAGALSNTVTAVVAMSSQTYGTDLVPRISPRPLLLLHGSADEVLSDACSRYIYAHAKEPKELRLYPGCGHGLDECREQVDTEVVGWLVKQLTAPKAVH